MAAQRTHITDIVRRWEQETPDREAIRSDEGSWTWSEWAARIRRGASAQLAAGLRPGDRVAYLGKNHPACLETTLACAWAGTVNAVVNFRLAADELAYVVNDAQARLLFVGAEFLPVFEGIRGKLPTVEQVVVVGGESDTYEAWLAAGNAAAPDRTATPDECFLQLYTSGTTGLPKGAMLTHRSMAAHTLAAAPAFGYTQGSVNLVALPLFHVGGTSWALLSMCSGGRTIIVGDVVPERLLDQIVAERVSHAFLVPAVYGMLLAVPDVAMRDYSSVRCLGYGGSPMPLPLLERCLQVFDVDFFQVYGMTEMSGVFSILPPADHRDDIHRERLGSAGKPIPGVEVKVVDPHTLEELPAGSLGEFWVRSAQHMSGYWGRPEATADVLGEDGWLRTGDAGRLDEAGYLFVEDRIKDVIISGGENIYPAEVERTLVGHPSVAEVAVIGVPDERWGEAVKAVVVATAGAVLDEQELIAFCRDRIAGYKCPKSIDVVDVLPRTPTGKLLKRELRAPYWAAGDRQI
ncbi:MAG: long-chain-fatty-acid--CoA ligase [Haloechinothrix sp.]